MILRSKLKTVRLKYLFFIKCPADAWLQMTNDVVLFFNFIFIGKPIQIQELV